VPANVLAGEASESSYAISSSFDTAETFHTASSPCSIAGECAPVNFEVKRSSVQQVNAGSVGQLVACVGCDDTDELSSTEDSYLRAAVGSNGVVNSEHSTSSFEKISPPTEIHSNTRQHRSQFMDMKVSSILRVDSERERKLIVYRKKFNKVSRFVLSSCVKFKSVMVS
jgi:hypothetical protein